MALVTKKMFSCKCSKDHIFSFPDKLRKNSSFCSNVAKITRYGVNFCVYSLIFLGTGHQLKILPLDSLMQTNTIVLCYLNFNELLSDFRNHNLLYKPQNYKLSNFCWISFICGPKWILRTYSEFSQNFDSINKLHVSMLHL